MKVGLRQNSFRIGEFILLISDSKYSTSRITITPIGCGTILVFFAHIY